MPEIKFKTPRITKATKEDLVGKPLHKDGVVIGHVTDAMQIEIEGEPYWEVTGEVAIEIEKEPEAVSIRSVRMPSRLPRSMRDLTVIDFLLPGRSETFLTSLDYDSIRERCIAGVMWVAQSEDYVDAKTREIKQGGMIGRVLGVHRVREGLVVTLRFNEPNYVINDDAEEASVEYSLTAYPDTKVTLAWSGTISNSDDFKVSTGCFYLTTRSNLKPM